MKKLTKIKLINWMYFTNHTIEIGGNTLITGVNASGKSTIIDALQFLFMGGLRGVKFNSAANEQGKRTLEGYLRGKISAEGQEFLRSSSCIGHIAVEIADENDNSSILGVALELAPTISQCKTTFYKINQTKLIDDYYVTKDQYPNSYKALEKYAKQHGKVIEYFGTTIQYRVMLKSYLGIDSDKYAKLLPNAIGVGSVTKMDDFINNFLLEEDFVEVNGLQENIQSIKRLIERIKLDEKKVEDLNEILEKGDVIANRKEKIRIIEIAKIIAEFNDYDTAIKKLEKELDDLRENRKIYDARLNQKNQDAEGQREKVKEIENALDQNNENRALLAIDKRIREIDIELSKQNEYFEETVRILTQLKKDIAQLVANGCEKLSVTSTAFDVNNGSDLLRSTVKEVYLRFQELKDSYGDGIHKIKEKLDDNVVRTKSNNEKLNNLRKNIKNYPHYVTDLVACINERLSVKYGKNLCVKPLCEFADTIDEVWRNALEGYLNTQRFDLICDPSLFDDCLEIYDEIKFKQKIFGIGIVNTDRFYDDVTSCAGTLSDKITFHNKFARNYAYRILNRVVCVDKLNELKKYDNAITSTCMRYSQNVARQIAPQVYETPYLGLSANKLQIAALEKENSELTNEYAQLRDEFYERERQLTLIKNTEIDKLYHNESLLASIDRCRKLLEEKTKEEKSKKELEANPSYIFLKERLEKENKKYKSLENDIITIRAQLSANRDKIEKINFAIDEKNDGKRESETCLKNAEREYRTLIPEAHKRYAESANGKNDKLQSIITSLDNAKNNYSTSRHESELTEKMTEYCIAYNFGAGKTFDALRSYLEEKSRIEETHLVNFRNDLEDMTNKNNKIFQEDFIAQIRTRIGNCKEQIDVLNEQLKEKRFGDDQYRMECTMTRDSEMRRYYNLIMDESYDNIGTLFADEATAKYKRDFDQMIKEITDVAAKGEANKFLDYRKYLNFDIVISGKNGVRRFNDLKHIQSGGEGQVPFYIIAAVSFQNLLTKGRSRSNLCVVLFDEAFNNMDPQRIKTMMEFYKSLNIQIFLSLTGEKIGNIVKYMDTTVAVIRDGNRVEIKEFSGAYNDR